MIKLRDLYFNKETGEIRVVVLKHHNNSGIGLALPDNHRSIIFLNQSQFLSQWEKV